MSLKVPLDPVYVDHRMSVWNQLKPPSPPRSGGTEDRGGGVGSSSGGGGGGGTGGAGGEVHPRTFSPWRAQSPQPEQSQTQQQLRQAGGNRFSLKGNHLCLVGFSKMCSNTPLI